MTGAPVKRRMELVLGVLLSVYVVFTLRAYHLQVAAAEEQLSRAQWGVQSETLVEIPRAPIVDRRGHVLAESVLAPTIVVDPRLLFTESTVEDIAFVRDAVAGLERFDADEFAGWMAADPGALPRYRVLERAVAPARAAALLGAVQARGVRSIFAEDSYRRVYPNGTLAGHALGFVDGHGVAGVAGIELSLNDELAGGTVEVSYERDSAREPYLLADLPDFDSARGETVRLTLDAQLQAFAEQTLAETIDSFEAESGLVVVSRPATGELLVMASWPPLNPNNPDAYLGDTWTNPVVSHVWEPGSTAKTFTFAAALDAGAVRYDTVIDCEDGRVTVDRYRIRDRHCDGEIPAWQAIRDSSNIGALKIGMRVGQELHYSYLRAFGFGDRLAAGLPGEARGLLSTPPWAESRHATISYGYGISVTALQLNLATATIANGGVRMQPTIVVDRTDGTGEVTVRHEPTVAQRVVSEATSALVTAALETVVSEEGTARLAAVPGFSVAGKTGTARLLRPEGGYGEDYRAVFTGFVPSQEPAFAITVMVERPDPEIGYYGGTVAAPVFAAIAAHALAIDGIVAAEPADEADAAPAGARPAAPAADGRGADGLPLGDSAAVAHPRAVPAARPEAGNVSNLVAPSVPDLRGLWPHEALRVAGERGFGISVSGVGRVASQRPAPDESSVRGSVIELVLSAGADAGGDDAAP